MNWMDLCLQFEKSEKPTSFVGWSSVKMSQVANSIANIRKNATNEAGAMRRFLAQVCDDFIWNECSNPYNICEYFGVSLWQRP